MTIALASTLRRATFGLSIAIAAAAGGCANDGSTVGGLFSTGTIGDAAPAAVTAKAAIDPVCASMASQIDTLRREGSVERLEKAADGKTSAVSVQRASLAKQSQLNRLNADFIAKCGPALPKPAVTAAIPPAVVAAVPAVAKPAATAVKAAAAAKAVAPSSGVTVVPTAAAVVAPAPQ